jgi:hypothetical protein
MYIVAIAWIYVTLLMAATEPSFVGGVLTFVLYGLAPLALLVCVLGRRRPRSRAMRQSPDQPDGHHPEPDQ